MSVFVWWSGVALVVHIDSVIYGGAWSHAMSLDLSRAETAVL